MPYADSPRPMIATRGELVLGLVLAVTLAYGVRVAYQPEPDGGGAARNGQPLRETSRPAPDSPPLLLDVLRRRPHGSEPEVNVFGARAWRDSLGKASSSPAPARVPPSQQAAAPAPPPALPFRYMGQLLTSNERMLFLASGDRNLVLREGDVVDTAYRLDHIDEFEATFTYLELGVQLRLSFLLEPSGVAQEERDVTVDAAVMHGGSRLGTAAGAEGEQRLGVMPSPNAIATRLQGRGPESSEELLSAAEARRARAVLAIPREPWVCAAQQANVLRDCDAKGDKDPTTACKQAAASRYRACLGSSLRSALPSTAGHEE